jgi:clan AA aspartic protease (TIGR02281 family)
MGRFLPIVLIALALAVPVQSASLDQQRIAAIDQAAKDFLAKVAEAHKTGLVPRQTDPTVAPLLDTVFDTGDLSHGPVPYEDFDRLHDWLKQIAAVGGMYGATSRAIRDFGILAPELGRFFDAVVEVTRAIADSMAAELLEGQLGKKPSAGDLRLLTQTQTEATGNLIQLVRALRAPGVTLDWVQKRVTVLIGAAPTIARFLKPEELARLRATLLREAAETREKTTRAMLVNVAVALATPPPLPLPPGSPVSGEIVLESYGQGYSVPVSINGAPTVKFVIDSGAAVVALPKNLVEDLTKAGTIAASDLRGRDVYVTADGKRHHGTLLMLRQLDVGGHTVTNVIASVGPANTEPLLGQSFLDKFKSWTLDNQRHVLIIVE